MEYIKIRLKQKKNNTLVYRPVIKQIIAPTLLMFPGFLYCLTVEYDKESYSAPSYSLCPRIYTCICRGLHHDRQI